MKIEDMANWTVDQLKKEVVRLSEECEEKQHKILDLQEYQIELGKDFDKAVEECKKAHEELNRVNNVVGTAEFAKDGTIDLPFYDSPEEIAKCKNQHQSDCITINQLQTALDVLVDRYANLRKIHGLS